MFSISRTVFAITTILLIQCGGEALANIMCADDNWYFDLMTLRCKSCTVCVEELGKVELTPCDDLSDRICVDVPQSGSPWPAPEEFRLQTEREQDLDTTTVNPDLLTVPVIDPEDGAIIASEKSLPMSNPVTEGDLHEPLQKLQAIIDHQAARLIFWRYSAYGLSAALGFTIVLVIVLFTCIYCPVHRHSIAIRKGDLEKGTTKTEPRNLELDYMECDLEEGYGDLHRPRLFSRGRLSSADFLRSLSSHEKKRESKEGLFDQMIYPPPNMYSQSGSVGEVFPDNNNFQHTVMSDDDSGLPNCDSSATTSKGNIVSHEDKYSITDAHMQDPVIETQLPEFVSNSPSQKQLVTHWSQGKAVSVTTLQSYDV
ncbi:uncharacterized protein LOC100374137 [Saccoglossus kowalevskii]|uniref:Uncharacterized protein LOC100374137 n=1 Tax=Saccoglossus kowalevskii TaxID=10224 RepID=A0ABM0GW34_SACKO|nr:PREDICTED: uncharacterized protein LOC100374137 [Saccoglossus kowalevskii]